jgi:hypothetical protein
MTAIQIAGLVSSVIGGIGFLIATFRMGLVWGFGCSTLRLNFYNRGMAATGT